MLNPAQHVISVRVGTQYGYGVLLRLRNQQPTDNNKQTNTSSNRVDPY